MAATEPNNQASRYSVGTQNGTAALHMQLKIENIVHTIIPLKLTFDSAKDRSNIAKHGVSLIDRSETRRIISLRKANKREVKRYASKI